MSKHSNQTAKMLGDLKQRFVAEVDPQLKTQYVTEYTEALEKAMAAASDDLHKAGDKPHKIAANVTSRKFGGNTVYFSYDTPIAALLADGTHMARAKKFGPTTTRHLNRWFGDWPQVDEATWQAKVGAVTGEGGERVQESERFNPYDKGEQTLHGLGGAQTYRFVGRCPITGRNLYAEIEDGREFGPDPRGFAGRNAALNFEAEGKGYAGEDFWVANEVDQDERLYNAAIEWAKKHKGWREVDEKAARPTMHKVRQVTRDVFTFSELGEKAQEKARQWYRESDTISSEMVDEQLKAWFEDKYPFFKDVDLQWSVGWSQSDFAKIYKARIDVGGYMKYAGIALDSDLSDEIQSRMMARVSRGELDMEEDSSPGNYDYDDADAEQAYDVAFAQIRDGLEELLKDLNNPRSSESIYREAASLVEGYESDENVDDTIIANEYEFDEYGNRLVSRVARPDMRKEYYGDDEEDGGERKKRVKRGSLKYVQTVHGYALYGKDAAGDRVFIAEVGDTRPPGNPNNDYELEEAYDFETFDKASAASVRKADNDLTLRTADVIDQWAQTAKSNLRKLGDLRGVFGDAPPVAIAHVVMEQAMGGKDQRVEAARRRFRRSGQSYIIR